MKGYGEDLNYLLVVGKLDCHSCDVCKDVLASKRIEFTYVTQETLPQEEWSKYRREAISHKQMSMPILFKNGSYITLEEVIG